MRLVLAVTGGLCLVGAIYIGLHLRDFAGAWGFIGWAGTLAAVCEAGLVCYAISFKDC